MRQGKSGHWARAPGDIAPLSWQEIRAWQDATGTPLASWEAAAIRDLSMIYCEQHIASVRPDCMAPWMDENFDRAEAARRMRARHKANG